MFLCSSKSTFIVCSVIRELGRCKFPLLPAGAMLSFVSTEHWRVTGGKRGCLPVPVCSAWPTLAVQVASASGVQQSLVPRSPLQYPLSGFMVDCYQWGTPLWTGTLAPFRWFCSEFWSNSLWTSPPSAPRSHISSKFCQRNISRTSLPSSEPQPSSVRSRSQVWRCCFLQPL